MKKFTLAYIPVGVPTFHLESAKEQFAQSLELLQKLPCEMVAPQEMLLTIDDLEKYLQQIEPSAIIFQNLTFANAAYMSEVLRRFECPLLLWTLKEPVIDGGRLRLNSLTGAYSAANTLSEFGREFVYLFGAPSEKATIVKLSSFVAAAQIRYDIQRLNIGAIGHTPQGFGFGRALDSELLSQFGARLLCVEAREMINKAKSYTDTECEEYIKKTEKATCGFCETAQQNKTDHARLYKAYSEFIKQNNIGAIASRCWPDFFTEYGTPVCTVLSMLNNEGIAASCEADVYGALSMYIGQNLSSGPVFFGDPVSMNEQEGTVTYWHCGAAAPALAKDTKAIVGVHPNRKIGPAMDFGCKGNEPVTIFRIGRKAGGKGFRMFIEKGTALEKEKQFIGTSVVVKTEKPAAELINSSVLAGYEPHFVVIYGDVADTLKILAKLYKFEVE